MAENAEKTHLHPAVWIITGVILGILLKLFVIDVLRVSGTSMETAIPDGSTVYVNKLAYGLVKPGNREFFTQWAQPREGDVVIFLHDNKIVVKRCAAEGGTYLDYLDDSGYYLLVGDRKITLTEQQYRQMKSSSSVPDGYILALGDNLDASIDSRSYGFVSVKNVVGRVIGK
jgi:signal peptidase I